MGKVVICDHCGTELLSLGFEIVEVDYPRTEHTPERCIDVLKARVAELEKLYRAAYEWWLMKRHVAFTPKEHFEQPKVNTTTRAEGRLAMRVAALTPTERGE